MIDKILKWLSVLLGVFGINVLSSKRGKKLGKTEAELEQADEELDAVDRAKRTRDRLESDPDYADSVRRRSTRR